MRWMALNDRIPHLGSQPHANIERFDFKVVTQIIRKFVEGFEGILVTFLGSCVKWAQLHLGSRA